jgi:DNA-binding protein YbaB
VVARDAEEFLRALGIPRHDEVDEDDAAPSGAGGGRGRSVLADLDRLRGEAEKVQRQFSVPAAEHRGHDGAGAVRVTVGANGRVADIEIDRFWRSAVGEHGLSAAAWTETVVQQPAATVDRAPRVRPPSGADVSGSGVPADSHAARRSVEELISLLEGIEAELDVFERRVGERAQQQVVGRSPSHLVKVTVAGGGQLVDVDIQRRLMQRGDERSIARELRSAFHAAYERATSLKLDDLLGDGRLARMRALTSDPDELLRRLGLGRQ